MSRTEITALQEAAAAVRGSYRDDEAYVLLPESDERHFLSEAILIGIGGTLVAAFLRGLSASVEGRVEQWGKNLGTWLVDRMESLVATDHPATTAVAVDLQPALAEARQLPADPNEQLAQDILANALISRGMTKRTAQAAAAAAAAEGNRLRTAAAG